LVPAAALLVLVTFAASCFLGRMSVWVGTTAAVVVLMNTTRIGAAADPWAPHVNLMWTAGTVVGVIGWAAYVFRDSKQ
jgi:hypothetical protein